MGLGQQIIRRFVGLIFVVLGVTLVTFVISHMIPGDPAQMLAGPRASAAAVAKIRAGMGLDQPLLVQYGRYLTDLAQGNFGISIVTNHPVMKDLAQVFPATLELMLTALFISVTLGIILGVVAAVTRDGPLDYLTRFMASLSIAVPSFWTALVLLLLFYGVFGLLPGDGRLSAAFDPPPHLTGFYLIDAAAAGEGVVFWDALKHIILPAATLALASLGGFIRIIRTSMIEVLGEDYIRTALANGLSWRRVVFGHALRNALIPFVTVLGLEFATVLFGSVVVESIFMWPGAGSYVLNAIFTLDFPTIMCFTLVVSVAYVIINMAVDLLYMAINPQIREIG